MNRRENTGFLLQYRTREWVTPIGVDDGVCLEFSHHRLGTSLDYANRVVHNTVASLKVIGALADIDNLSGEIVAKDVERFYTGETPKLSRCALSYQPDTRQQRNLRRFSCLVLVRSTKQSHAGGSDHLTTVQVPRLKSIIFLIMQAKKPRFETTREKTIVNSRQWDTDRK